MIDVERWLAAGGFAILAAVVFAESGLLIGFFLPGDTLLFVAGFLSSNAEGHVLPALPRSDSSQTTSTNAAVVILAVSLTPIAFE